MATRCLTQLRMVRPYFLPGTVKGSFVAMEGASTRKHHSGNAASDQEVEMDDGRNAYEVLGVSEKSSLAEIKTSFRELAKETHPDVAASSSGNSAAASRRFLQILAAYEILSDSQRRAYYDSFLVSQRRIAIKPSKTATLKYYRSSSVVVTSSSDVVQWLKWYRLTIDDVLAHKKFATGSTYLDKLENEFYSALRAAYYGPEVESLDRLPNCFEAEERSTCKTSELLHLVTGRDMFGIVKIVDGEPKLSPTCHGKFAPNSVPNGISQHSLLSKAGVPSLSLGTINHQKEFNHVESNPSDIYKDLEMEICGKVVAVANRNPRCNCIHAPNADSNEHVHVFLTASEETSSTPAESRILLGTVTGLKTTGEEGLCFFYNAHGKKTHMLVKHRTLLVKHMHWYQLGHDVSSCECRCSRACLPPSRLAQNQK